ncbi:hypothetical protein CRUP_037067 [Coryphaenoides rupestris]|nr:hypothetical protein CRUP_037067 [Coryphaenoides rupestris]
MDNFLVEKGIGKGTFGIVLKCLDQTNGEHVAVKKLAELNSSKLEKAIARRLHLVFELMDHSIDYDIKESRRAGLDT